MAQSCDYVGIPFNQYDVMWVMCMHGVVVDFSMFVPSFANWLAISLLVILVCDVIFLYCYFVCDPLYLIDNG